MDAIQAIFACKMYKSNPNKSKIASALQDPVNKELVKQLRSYLDDEYQTEEYLEPDNLDDANAELDETAENDEEIIPSEGGGASGGGGEGFSGGDFDGGSGNLPGMSVENPDNDSDDSISDIPDNASSDESDVEESIKVSKKKVTASKIACILSDKLDSLKGLLNSRADLAGVNRILIRENELWIYYDDSVNMNDVMGPVIELLHLSDYNMLEFNRLARSDNAIVFEILEGTSSVEPEENDEDGKKA